MKRLLASILLIGALLAPSSSAFAYTYLYDCGPSWPSLPVSYWINSAGSDNLAFSTVESIIADSFAAWGDPCCSNFVADYRGTTSLTATNNQGNVVLSWVESGWNPQWGSVNVTIGITFTSVLNNCTISEAPIIFNGVGFQFSNGGGGTDMQSISTHEIGHLLGLGHSSVQSATMFASYSGGTGSRSLHQDDIDGVCSLYTTSCSCTTASQCAAAEQCIGGQCKVPPCQNDNDCDTGLSCNTSTGKCGLPPCGSDADCAAGFQCQANVCVSGCPVCRKNCGSNADCGANGFCVNVGDGPECWVLCGQNGTCPGDSECYIIDDGNGGDAYVCGSPDAVQTGSLCKSGSAISPTDYVCDANAVSDECSSAADCANGEICANTVDGRRCQMPEDPCATLTCAEGLICQNGLCIREDISNNNPGNTNTNTNTNPNNITPANNGNGTGNNGNGNTSDPDVIVVFGEEPTDNQGCCAVTHPRRVPSAALLLLVGLLWSRRRRR